MKIYKIGDLVMYEGVEYRIEKVYNPRVYLIGNETSFVDLVNIEELTESPNNYD